MIEDISLPKLLIILLIALIFFGGRRLPELAASLGKSIREFKKGMQDVQDEVKKEIPQASNETRKSDDKSVHSS